jgi:hypothetical protein
MDTNVDAHVTAVSEAIAAIEAVMQAMTNDMTKKAAFVVSVRNALGAMAPAAPAS